ncbi:hypothetical protein DFJ63DRAFT_312099 [Scheffersomyces coipomensis]|uniref:uncharacterized protein n=1 Tax=Scheffersomyces coipomensis TaxID=1788519 RepID=UPI00315DE50F
MNNILARQRFEVINSLRISPRYYASVASPKYVKVGATTTAKPRTTTATSRPSYSKSTTSVAKESSGSEDVGLMEDEGFDAIDEPSSSPLSLHDGPTVISNANPNDGPIDWSDSFFGLGSNPFPRDVADVLLAPLPVEDVEITPDGLIYLPEIKYRRVLNRAFGPGGWGLAPRTETLVTPKQISREYALICHGRLVSVARGEQDYFGGEEKITTALEGCKSNALMRCCKDLGIASELWDPTFIREFKKKYCDDVFAEHIVTKRKKKLWKLKKNKALDYPYKMV